MIIYKIVVIGENEHGKPSLIHRYVYDTFRRVVKPTNEVDFVQKQMITKKHQINRQHNNNYSFVETKNNSNEICTSKNKEEEITFQITKIYYQDAYGVILVCDINRLFMLSNQEDGEQHNNNKNHKLKSTSLQNIF